MQMASDWAWVPIIQDQSMEERSFRRIELLLMYDDDSSEYLRS